MLGRDPVAFHGDSATRLVGSLALVAAMVVYAMALEALRQADRTPGGASPQVWYFGYIRDFTNALGLVLIGLAHYLIGFPLHLALAAGFATGLLLYVLDYAFAFGLRRTRHLGMLVATMTAVTAPTLFYPRAVASGLDRLIATLFH